MPELPEVEIVRRGLEPAMVGQSIDRVILNRPDLRIPFPDDFVQRIAGQKVEALERRAKYLLCSLGNGAIIIMHLGMSGHFTIHRPSPQSMELESDLETTHNNTPLSSKKTKLTEPERSSGKHDHVVFVLADGCRIIYTDHRRFGLMTICDTDGLEAHPLLAQAGPEPLSDEFTDSYLSDQLQGRQTPIKAALLNQTIVAGLGNIYVCEALYYAGISPKRKAASIPGKRATRLVTAIKDVLTRAIDAGGSTLRDYAHTDGNLGYFQHSFSVYGREGEPCKTDGCEGLVHRLVQSNRSTFYCPICQR